MKMAKFMRALLTVGVVAACAGMLAACSGGASSSGGGVAATVNGTEIAEDNVTTTVQNVRAQSSLEDEESWANFLIDNDMTPESVREQIIDSLVDQELIKSGAASLEVSVDSSEVDTYVESMKANFDSDEAWAEALEQAGFTEDEYRENIESSLLQQQLNTYFQDNAEVSDDEILESAQTYATYYDGAKRSSHILFKVEDTTDEAAMKDARKKAQDVLDKVKSGEIDFADAAKEYSDDSSADNGGDVGWDVLNTFVTEYTDALADLDKGDVSDLVESQYGIHIIKVTDTFKAPKKVKKLSSLPEEFQSTITDMAKSIKANDDYTAWLDEQHEAADIVINDMPADVPYNVDLTKYQESDEGEEGSEEAADADGNDEGDEDIEIVEEGEDDGEDVDAEVIEVEEEADAADADAEAEAEEPEPSKDAA